MRGLILKQFTSFILSWREGRHLVLLGCKQRGATVIKLSKREIFRELSFTGKLKYILDRRSVGESVYSVLTLKFAQEEIFGFESDFGEPLFRLNHILGAVEWDQTALTEEDVERASALESFGLLVSKQFYGVQAMPPLNLSLWIVAPKICLILVPMVFTVLIRTVRYYVEIHAFYTFSRIRRSQRPNKTELINLIYDVTFLQQKTALAVLELQKCAAVSMLNRSCVDDASIHLDELKALMNIDLLVSYLKASIEKIMLLIGEVLLLPPIDGKRKHADRVRSLYNGMSEHVRSTPYAGFILDYIRPESLEDLNSLRTGLLHKRGIGKLQPHSFGADSTFADLPLMELLDVMKEYHRKNSIALLGALAMLADEDMRFIPPIDREKHLEDIKRISSQLGIDTILRESIAEERT